MSIRPQRARQPAGIPIGGQFAQTRRAPAGIVLDDPWEGDQAGDLDPWAVQVPPVTGTDEVRAIADRISLATGTVPSVLTSASTDENEAAHRLAEELNEARRGLAEEYGSIEAATRHVGEKVAARAEEIAGVSAEEVRQRFQARLDEATRAYDRAKEQRERALAELDEVEAPYRKRLIELGNDERGSRQWLDIAAERDEKAEPYRRARREALDAFYAASDAKNALTSGSDPQVQADLRRLADGYQAAIAEVRGVGGQMVWNDRSTKKAVTAFDEAASVFPTDWIDASNERTREQTRRSRYRIATEGEVAPFVKISDRRAHYVDMRTQKKTTRGVDRTLSRGFGEKDVATWGRSSSPYYEYEPVSQAELDARGDFEPALWRTTYTVASRWDHGHFDEDTPPRGRGWEKWVSPEDPTRTAWRRPKTRVNTEGYTSSAQITTNKGTSRVEGRPGTFAVAAHELAHRFESTVSGISELEAQFVTRRTTDPQTGKREPLKRLYPRSKEYARPDNFITAYMGKDYGTSRYHEVMSMGVQALYGGDSGGLIGVNGHKPDEDMRAFVLGVLASAGRKNG